MSINEADIIHEGPACYVMRLAGNVCEIRAHAGTHSVLLGTVVDAERAIRVAKALDRYPKQVADAVR
jgi:hypothetical protein